MGVTESFIVSWPEMSGLFQFFHETEQEIDPPQHCERCGRVLVSPGAKMPFVPGQLVLDTWDISEEPPVLMGRAGIDTLEKPMGSPWCTEVTGIPE